MAKIAAYGSALLVQYAQTGAFINIANLGDFSGPEVSVDTIDVTTHDSPDKFNEFVPGMADGGEVTFDLVFDPALAVSATLYNAVADRVKHNFRARAPGYAVATDAGGGWFAFAGFFTKFAVSNPVKDKLGATCNIKVSGKPVWVPFV